MRCNFYRSFVIGRRESAAQSLVQLGMGAAYSAARSGAGDGCTAAASCLA
jgi:hypothetical protein